MSSCSHLVFRFLQNFIAGMEKAIQSLVAIDWGFQIKAKFEESKIHRKSQLRLIEAIAAIVITY
jgi:hypothetical protein